MKKTGLITVIIAVILLFSSCSRDTKPTEATTTAPSEAVTQEQPTGTADTPISLSDILTQIKDNVTLPEMMDYSENDIKTQLGVTTEDYSEVTCSASNDGYYPDFIFIAKAKDSSALDKMESKLGNYRSHKINEWKDYLPDVPERFEAIERSTVIKKGDYVYLVISTEDANINGIISEKIS
ncbi:MAG: DUF4358 domain-containing protein [Eubacteriales bacterium]